jgi:hypothetical protein
MPDAASWLFDFPTFDRVSAWAGGLLFYPFFADTVNDGRWIALGTLLGSLFTGLVSGLVVLFNSVHKARQESRSRHFREQEVILDRQEKQIARLEANALEQQGVISHIHDLHADCRSEAAQLRLYLSVLLEYIRRQQRAGILTEPPPDLPEALQVRPDDADFVAKSSAQNAILLAGVTSKIRGGPHADSGG